MRLTLSTFELRLNKILPWEPMQKVSCVLFPHRENTLLTIFCCCTYFLFYTFEFSFFEFWFFVVSQERRSATTWGTLCQSSSTRTSPSTTRSGLKHKLEGKSCSTRILQDDQCWIFKQIKVMRIEMFRHPGSYCCTSSQRTGSARRTWRSWSSTRRSRQRRLASSGSYFQFQVHLSIISSSGTWRTWASTWLWM